MNSRRFIYLVVQLIVVTMIAAPPRVTDPSLASLTIGQVLFSDSYAAIMLTTNSQHYLDYASTALFSR